MSTTLQKNAHKHTHAYKLSQKKLRVFLEELAKSGCVSSSAERAGYSDTTFLYKVRKQDEEFAEAWAEAEEAGTDILLGEARRRAVEGVDEPVFYKGEVVGYKRNYSDSMLMFLIKGKRPEFRDRAQTDVKIDANLGVAFLPTSPKSVEDWEKNAIEVHNSQKTALPNFVNSDSEILEVEVIEEEDDPELADLLGEVPVEVQRG